MMIKKIIDIRKEKGSIQKLSFSQMKENAYKLIQKEIAYDILKLIKNNEFELFNIIKLLPYSQDSIFDCFDIYYPDLFSFRNHIVCDKSDFNSSLLVKATANGINFFFENSVYKR